VLEGLRRAAAAAAAAAFLQAHGHRLLTPDDTSPEVLRQLQQAAEARARPLALLPRVAPGTTARAAGALRRARRGCRVGPRALPPSRTDRHPVAFCAPRLFLQMTRGRLLVGSVVRRDLHGGRRWECGARACARQVPDEEVDAAREAMAQAAVGMRDICRSGNVLLLPALPGPPPERARGRGATAEPDAAADWERGALQLSALAALAGVPQVRQAGQAAFRGLGQTDKRAMGQAGGGTAFAAAGRPPPAPALLSAAGDPGACRARPREAAHPSAVSAAARAQVCIPVPLPGRPPAGIALIGMAKSDLRLLAVAEGLGPLVAEAAALLAAAAAAAGGAGAAAAEARRGADEGGGDGVAGPSRSAAGPAAAHANGHAGPAGRGGRPGAPLGLQDLCATAHGGRGPAWASPAASVLGNEAGRRRARPRSDARQLVTRPDERGAGKGAAAGKGDRAREAAEAAKLEGNAAVAAGDFEAAAEVRGGLDLWQGPRGRGRRQRALQEGLLAHAAPEGLLWQAAARLAWAYGGQPCLYGPPGGLPLACLLASRPCAPAQTSPPDGARSAARPWHAPHPAPAPPRPSRGCEAGRRMPRAGVHARRGRRPGLRGVLLQPRAVLPEGAHRQRAGSCVQRNAQRMQRAARGTQRLPNNSDGRQGSQRRWCGVPCWVGQGRVACGLSGPGCRVAGPGCPAAGAPCSRRAMRWLGPPRAAGRPAANSRWAWLHARRPKSVSRQQL
jgi:hypothetical protein